jgi:hypothetical protein
MEPVLIATTEKIPMRLSGSVSSIAQYLFALRISAVAWWLAFSLVAEKEDLSVTSHRQLLIEELRHRNFAETTIRSQAHGVEHFSRSFHRHPNQPAKLYLDSPNVVGKMSCLTAVRIEANRL